MSYKFSNKYFDKLENIPVEKKSLRKGTEQLSNIKFVFIKIKFTTIVTNLSHSKWRSF